MFWLIAGDRVQFLLDFKPFLLALTRGDKYDKI